MVLRVAEVERLDAARVLIPRRQGLRCGRDMLYLRLAQSCVSFVHVAHDDRDVLEPMVEAARILRDGPPFVEKMLRESDVLLAELKIHTPQLRAAQAE